MQKPSNEGFFFHAAERNTSLLSSRSYFLETNDLYTAETMSVSATYISHTFLEE